MENDSDVINRIFNACKKLQLPVTTRNTACILYNLTVEDLNKYYSLNRIAFSCVYLASKATERFVDPEVFSCAVGYSVDWELEAQILQTAEFCIDFIDIFGYIESICGRLGLEVEEKKRQIEMLFCKRGVFKEYSVDYLCISVFSWEEIGVVENIYGFEVDRRRIEEIKLLL